MVEHCVSSGKGFLVLVISLYLYFISIFVETNLSLFRMSGSVIVGCFSNRRAVCPVIFTRLNWQVTFLYTADENLSGPTSCLKDCVNPPHPSIKITLTEEVTSYQHSLLEQDS